MPKVFISYSRSDKAIAEHIAAHLRNRNADVFVDYQKLIGGENFMERIGNEIAKCDKFLVLLSPRAVESQWVQAEVAWAFANKKDIIPVIIEITSMVNFFVLANLQQVDFSRWTIDGNIDDAVIKLAQALSLDIQPTENNPIPPLPTHIPDPSDEVFEEKEKVSFARQNLSDLFITAAEVADSNPDQALFLYHQIYEADPNYMGFDSKEFVEREELRLKPIRLSKMLSLAEDSINAGKWRQAERVCNDIILIDQNNDLEKKLI